jgi:hypothetical protein
MTGFISGDPSNFFPRRSLCLCLPEPTDKANDRPDARIDTQRILQSGARRLVQSPDDKLHFLVQFTRYNNEDKAMVSCESLYILTKRNNRWGVQARSSFAGIAIPGVAF